MTVHIADLDEDTAYEQDAAATWLLGHTERVDFGEPYVRGRDLYVDAILRVPCKYLEDSGNGSQATGRGRCAAHGFAGPVPTPSRVRERTHQHGNDRFTLVHGRRLRTLTLREKRAPRRSLPVMQPANPCAGAACRTADNRQGAACCRDLTLDIKVGSGDTRTEPLLRSRRSPYLCKVKRTDPETIEAEMISACAYLADDGVACTLHGRVRPNGRPAKPEICSEWPDFEDDDEYTGHPGCVFIEDEA